MNRERGKDSFLWWFMQRHRLRVAEVAAAAEVSTRSLTRLRSFSSSEHDHDPAPRPATLRRIADALGSLSDIDSDEIFQELMTEAGHRVASQQGDLGTRGAAELARHFQRMNATA